MSLMETSGTGMVQLRHWAGRLFFICCLVAAVLGVSQLLIESGLASVPLAECAAETPVSSELAPSGVPVPLSAVRHRPAGSWRGLCGSLRLPDSAGPAAECGDISAVEVIQAFPDFMRHGFSPAQMRLRAVLNNALPVRAGPAS